MARARNIKPSFFTNEILGTLDPMVALTFAGLWCLADKDGILEDRPIRIKGELFPYRDGLDVNGYLTVLQLHKFIVRYVVDNVGYIKVLEFQKHQHPHHTEKAKGFPQPPVQVIENIDLFGNTGSLPLFNGYGTDISRRNPSDSGFLIPENGGVSTALTTPVDNSDATAQGPEHPTPPIPSEFLKYIIANRPDLVPITVWTVFCEFKKPEHRTIGQWMKWVDSEHAPATKNVAANAETALPGVVSTVPSKPGKDPELLRLDQEAQQPRSGPPPELKSKFAELRKARGIPIRGRVA